MGGHDMLNSPSRPLRTKLLLPSLLASTMMAGCSFVADPTDRSSPTSTVEAIPLPARATPFELVDAEEHSDVKQPGIDFLEATLNYQAGEHGIEAARQRVEQRGAVAYDDKALEDLKPLLDDSRAMSASIIYPQLGGLTDTEAALIVVLDVARQTASELRAATRVLDVRMTYSGGVWEVSRVVSTGGKPAETVVHSSASSAVENHGTEELNEVERDFVEARGIDLPDSSFADILTDEIHPLPLEILTDFSDDYDISVAVLRTGHPKNVFDTDRLSNHTRGRAIDVWAIDGIPVSELAKRSKENNPAYEMMALALEMGADEVGGPWRISTQYGATFSNEVHLDHIHIGFEAE